MSLCLQEHDYIGLSSEAAAAKVVSMENDKPIKKDLNLKATELRLGLPGSESPERDGGGVLKGCLNSLSVSVSGAKRGFSDTINGGSSKWVFSGSEVDLSKNGVGLFSPRSGGGGGDAKNSVLLPPTPNAVKEAVSPPKPLMEKNPQTSHSSTVQGAAPATKAQVVGWPPIRSFRKNTMAVNLPKNEDDTDTKLGSGCLYVKVSMDGAPYLRKVDLKIYSSYMELSSALEKMFSCFTIGQCGSHGVPMRDGLTESRLMDLLHGSEYVLTYEDKDGDWMLVGDVPWDMFTGSCKRMRIMKSSDAIGLAPRAMEKCRNRN